jgi:CheY-like chemotaxis protein
VRRVTIPRLETRGYKVVAVENARSVLTLLESGALVDLVFSNVVLPEQDDIHRLLKLRKPYSHTELSRTVGAALEN